MSKIIWLASYPKSGNTWLRALLTNYMRDGDAPADINALDGGPIASARLWFDEWAGIEASALDQAVVERLRPQAYRCMAREAAETLFMKVHDAWGLTDRGEHLFPADITAGVVYVLRSPLDLAKSCAHHWGTDITQAAKNMCNPSFVVSNSREALAEQLPQRLGSWSGHVRSWLDESGLNVHLVRYEDLHADPEGTFGAVVQYCGLDFDPLRVRKAVRFSDFAELHRQEQAGGFREHSARAPGEFFRRGEVDAWRDELPLDLARLLLETQGETMRRFGYPGKEGDLERAA